MKARVFLWIASVAGGVIATVVGLSSDTGWRRALAFPGILVMHWCGYDKGDPPEVAIIGLLVNFFFFAFLCAAIGGWCMAMVQRRLRPR